MRAVGHHPTDSTLQNNPVGFSCNEDLSTIDIYGYRVSKSRKFRSLTSNNTVRK